MYCNAQGWGKVNTKTSRGCLQKRSHSTSRACSEQDGWNEGRKPQVWAKRDRRLCHLDSFSQSSHGCGGQSVACLLAISLATFLLPFHKACQLSQVLCFPRNFCERCRVFWVAFIWLSFFLFSVHAAGNVVVLGCAPIRECWHMFSALSSLEKEQTVSPIEIQASMSWNKLHLSVFLNHA